MLNKIKSVDEFKALVEAVEAQDSYKKPIGLVLQGLIEVKKC